MKCFKRLLPVAALTASLPWWRDVCKVGVEGVRPDQAGQKSGDSHSSERKLASLEVDPQAHARGPETYTHTHRPWGEATSVAEGPHPRIDVTTEVTVNMQYDNAKESGIPNHGEVARHEFSDAAKALPAQAEAVLPDKDDPSLGISAKDINFLDFNYKKDFEFDDIMKLEYGPPGDGKVPRPVGRALGLDGQDLGMDLASNYDRVFRGTKEEWSLEGYRTPSASIPVYGLKEGEEIGQTPLVLVHEFPVKIPGSDDMWVPKSFGKDTPSVHKILQKSHAVARKAFGEKQYTDEYYSYLEIRQKVVQRGGRFRSVGEDVPAHYDGWLAGDRDKDLPELGFHVSTGSGTMIFPRQGFNFTDRRDPLGEWKQVREHAKEAIAEKDYIVEPVQTLIVLDGYAVHCEPIEFEEDTLRTFIRIQFSTACWGSAKLHDLHNNSVNPKYSDHFQTDAQCKNEAYHKNLISRTRMFDCFSLEVRRMLADYLTMEELQELVTHLNNKDANAINKFVDQAKAMAEQAMDPVM